MNQRYSSPLRKYPTSNSSHRFHNHSTPLVRMIMTASRSYSVCNRTIGPISGSFFCHLAKSVQADQASWSVSICLSFQWQGRRSPSQRRQPLRVGADFVSFLQDVFEKRDNDCCNMEDFQLSVEDAENRAEWRRTHVTDPYLRNPQPEGERDSDWCFAVSYLLITSDDIAIIHYRCHLSGVQRQHRSVAQRLELARPPSKSDICLGVVGAWILRQDINTFLFVNNVVWRWSSWCQLTLCQMNALQI